jgi:hypothetical protein
MKKLTVLLLALAGVLVAQNWSAKLAIPPTVAQFSMIDLWSCRVTNPETTAVDIKLYGWISKNGQEIGSARSNAITCPRGVKLITAANIDPNNVTDTKYDPAYKSVVLEGAALPPGHYTVCIQVERASNREVLAKDCREITVGGKISPPILISPKNDATIQEPRPTFVWTSIQPQQAGVEFTIRIAEVPKNMTPQEALEVPRLLGEEKGIKGPPFTFPPEWDSLKVGSTYAWEVVAHSAGTEIKSAVWHFIRPRRDTTEIVIPPGSECRENIIKNWGFINGAVPGQMPSPGQVSNWGVGYGSPLVVADSGCEDFENVQLYGNKTKGSAITQQLNPQIQSGHVYELKVCVRVSPASPVPYVKLRALAFNGWLPSSGVHPPPNTDRAIIDVSGKIRACAGWTTYTFQRWKANKNFNNIAISVENNEPLSLSLADIDNICFAEVGDSIPCYLAQFDSLGNIVLPALPPGGLLDPDCPPDTDDVDIFMGSVSDIYANCAGAADGLDTWYENCPDSCASIGGTIPDEILNFDLQDSLNSLGITDSVGEILDSLLAIEDVLQGYAGNLLDTLFSLGAISFCDSLPPQGPPPNYTDSPFNGRDIVFVHGFRTDPLCDKMNGVLGAQKRWPNDEAEFYDGGYWKNGAEAYWREHIKKYLGVDPKGNPIQNFGQIYKNRFIVVAHPATQSGIRAVHAILKQIRDAMLYGRDVRRCDPNDTRPLNTFGHDGFVIISHSAGALFSNVAMKLSKLTGTNPHLGLMLGDVSEIAKRCDLHIALQGAFMGSNYASLALLGLTFQPVFGLAKDWTNWTNCNPYGHLWLFTSQLLDMAIPRYIYGGGLFYKLCNTLPTPFNIPYCLLANENLMEPPMCVITVAGGHPSEYGIIAPDLNQHSTLLDVVAKHLIHHGFDDGVVSIDCQCGNSDKRLDYPNRYFPRLGLLTWIATGILGQYGGLLNERVYDMGIEKERAIRYYLDQKLDILISHPTSTYWASAGCIPWLSPTGMVQPVAIPFLPSLPGYDALKRLDNHYSFLQSAADHYSGAIDPVDNDYYKTPPASDPKRNWEESRVITSNDVYDKCGVSATMKNLQEEYIRGKKIGPWYIKIPFIKKRWTIGPFWIWKRKYHLLQGSDYLNQLYYVYQYVLKP